MNRRFLAPMGLALAVALAGPAVQAQTACSSDGQPPPRALLERAINADCASCWIDTTALRAQAGDVALDWLAPGQRGDDAPLAAAASRDALTRLQALGRAVPVRTDGWRSTAKPGAARLRVAIGPPFNDYVGASIEWRAPRSGGPWTAWLALVETLPAGTEGSPVPRNLVRNLLQLSWSQPAAGAVPLLERRPMQLPEGTDARRVRVIGWVEDAQGRIQAIAQSVCPGTGAGGQRG